MKKLRLLEDVCTSKRGVDPKVLKKVLTLALEIAREGREGHKIGTIFVVGDTATVLEQSRTLILDPLKGHPDDVKNISDQNMRETVKELAMLDGGFVVSEAGVIVSATRYFNASAEGIDIPLGLGSRHLAAASISLTTKAVAVVVSESSVVRLFDDGELKAEIIPEIWLLNRHSAMLDKKRGREASTDRDITIVSRD